jgi:hypothetical protein
MRAGGRMIVPRKQKKSILRGFGFFVAATGTPAEW